jgi:hypothetical protein
MFVKVKPRRSGVLTLLLCCLPLICGGADDEGCFGDSAEAKEKRRCNLENNLIYATEQGNQSLPCDTVTADQAAEAECESQCDSKEFFHFSKQNFNR